MNTQRKIVDRISISLIFVYIAYTFWFQYAFTPVGGLLSAIGLLMLFVSLISFHKKLSYYKEMLGIVLFVLYFAVFGILVSNNVALSYSLLFQIIKYCIPFYAIYVYVGIDIKKLDNVMLSILICCSILAIWSFFRPVYNMTYNSSYSMREGVLNANVFSSYMMLGVMCCTYYLRKTQGVYKLILYAFLIVMLIAQLFAASRRGIIVCVLIVVTYLHSVISLTYKQNRIKKIATIVLVVIIACFILWEFAIHTDSLVGIQRLQGKYVGGDELRKYYRDIAVKLFSSSPLFGKGLGSVMNEIGVYSHSLYLELLACGGIIGTLLMLSYVIRFLGFFGKASFNKNSCANKLFARLMFWYVVALLTSGIAVVLIYDSYFYVLLAVFSVSYKVIKYNENELSNERKT